MYNTRIAPSPTGDMHLGTARTAYFNWLAARASGGKFILRIDDTDPERSKPEYTDVILRTMEWLGLDYDQLIRQSNNFDGYLRHAQNLIREGWAYESNGSILFNMKSRETLIPDHWMDEIVGKVPITENDFKVIGDMCLIRSTGQPTYNFASVIDDMNYDINYIIRGADHISNTCKQVILWKILQWMYKTPKHPLELPKFAHIGLIHLKGAKLSKRDGAASMLHYQEKGYDPDAVLNFMARLGWGPKVDDKTTKMLPRERMLELFLTGGSMKPSQANMDLDKLESFDRKYKASKGIWRNKEKLI